MRISHEKHLNRVLENMKPWQQVAFATAIAERALPNYALFADLAGFGDPKVLRHCLNLLWDHVAGRQSAKNFENLLEKLEPEMPDVDAYEMYGVYPALDAAVAICAAVNCALNPTATETFSAAKLAHTSIGKLIKYSEAPELKGTELFQYINEHPLSAMQNEFEAELIEQLQRGKQNIELVRALRTLAQNEGVSHLGISLD